MKYKLFAVDFDDTLARNDITVSDFTLKTIKEYQAKGGHFVLATGRAEHSARDICKRLDLHGLTICFQGGVIIDTEKQEPICKSEFSARQIIRICEFLKAQGYYYHIFDDVGFVADKVTWMGDMYQELSGCKRRLVDMPLEEFVEKTNFHTPKIVVIDYAENTRNDLKIISEHFKTECFASISKPELIELVPPDVNKACAVEKVCKLLNVGRQETICMGDSLNDKPMVEWAGLGIAVANAMPELKAVAKEISPSNEDDGVAKMIIKYGLN